MSIPWAQESLYGKTTGVDLSNSVVIDITATTHNLDWDTGEIRPQMIELNPDANWNLTGLVAPEGDEPTYLMLFNPTAFQIQLIHEGASSAAANRFALPDATNENIDPNESRLMVYLPSKGKWYNFGHSA